MIRQRHLNRRDGFTLVELFVCIVILGVLVCLLLPAQRTVGDAAKRMSCSNNLKQLALGLHNYHSDLGCFPTPIGSGVNLHDLECTRPERWSGLVALLPYIEQQALWEEMQECRLDSPAEDIASDDDSKPWQREIAGLRCPTADFETDSFAPTEYTFSIGDVALNIHAPNPTRGAFAVGRNTELDDFSDGTANTILLAEIGTPWNRSIQGDYAIEQPDNFLVSPERCMQLRDEKNRNLYAAGTRLLGRGTRWIDGTAGPSLVNTILPPNSPSSAIGGREAVDGIYSAGSYHTAGAQFAMADGTVRFIAETIDAGDASATPIDAADIESSALPSPYGVWGALGTLSGGEQIDPDF